MTSWQQHVFCRPLHRHNFLERCRACNIDLENRDLIKTNCGCFYCPSCLCDVLASKCGECGERGHSEVSYYAKIRPRFGRDKKRDRNYSNEVSFVTVQPRPGTIGPNSHPLQHCIREHRRDLRCGKTKIILYGAVVSYDSKEGYDVKAHSLVLDEMADGPEAENLTDEQVKEMCFIFGLARSHITGSSLWLTPDDVPILSPRELLEVYIADKRPLLKILTALVCRNPNLMLDTEMIRHNSHIQSQFLALCVSVDVLLRPLRPSPLYLQAMICDQQGMINTPDEFHNLLSALKLSASRTFLSRNSAKAAIDRMIEGKRLDHGDFIIIAGDNYAQHGRPDIEHFTMLYVVTIPKALLDRLNMDDYSREDNETWDEIVDEQPDRARRFMDETDRDNELLTGVAMGYQLEMLRWVSKNDIDEVEVRNRHETGDNTGVDIVNIRYIDPLSNAGVDCLAPEYRRIIDGYEVITEDGAFDVDYEQVPRDFAPRNEDDPSADAVGLAAARPSQSWETTDERFVVTRDKYKRNGAHVEMFHENLSTTRAAEAIVEAAKRTGLDLRYGAGNDGNNEEENDEDVEVPAGGRTRGQSRALARARAQLLRQTLQQHYGVPVRFDGDPIIKMYSFIDYDRATRANEYHHRVRPHYGPFHLQNNAFLRFTDLHEDNFEHLLGLVYSAEGVNHRSRPRDPRHREMENYVILSAMMSAAAIAVKKIKGRDVSAKEIHEHLLKRAKQYPTCAAIVLMQRHLTMKVMLQDSERHGPEGVEMFNSCNRFLVKLFATTHAPQYVRHPHEHLKFWEEASEAQKRIYSIFILTMQTPGGRWEWFDRFQEDVVKDHRTILGKKLTRGQVAKSEQAPFRIEERAGKIKTGGVSSMRGNERRIRQGPRALSPDQKKLFWAVQKEFLVDNIFGGGSPVIAGKDGHAIVCDEHTLVNLNGTKGNAALLNWYETSGEVVGEYRGEYYFRNLNSHCRSEKDVPIPRLMGSEQKRKDAYDKAVKINTTIDKADFKPRNPKKADMATELNVIRQKLQEANPPVAIPTYTGNESQEDLAEALAEHRDTLFTMYPGEKRNRIDNIKKQLLVVGESSVENREVQMSNPIITLYQGVVDKPQFSTRY